MPRIRLIVSRLLILWATLLLGAPRPLWGEDGTVLRFPVMGKTRTPSGLKMEIDTRWAEAQGYRPVRITLGSANGLPVPADLTVRVELTVFSIVGSEEPGDRTVVYVTLPEGKASITQSVPVLQESLWTNIEVKTFDDTGRELRDLSETFSASTNPKRVNQYYGWDQDAITFLVIHPKIPSRSQRTARTSGANPIAALKTTAENLNVANEIPDLRALALQIPDSVSPYYSRWAGGPDITNDANDPACPLTDSQLLDWLAMRSNFEMLPPDEVPLQWIELTCFDFIILPLDSAEKLASESPRRWTAIRDWTRAGGNLILYGVADASKREAIDRLFKAETNEEWWRPLEAGKNTTNVQHVQESYQAWARDRIQTIEIDKDRPTTEYFTVHTRECGMGALLAIAQSDIFPGTRRQWTALINSHPGSRALWSVRNGVSLSNSNIDSYWRFAIPGLGMAPVLLFVGLISVFVIVLGPVNYSYLKRRKQLSLLIFTVPIGALLTVFSLVMYALLGDGLGTRVRVWSVIDLDQKNGEAISFSHQTYYAGIPPWSGLSFPQNAAVYPVDQLPERMGYHYGYSRNVKRAPRELLWDENQRLTRGYVTSRTLSQMVVIHPITADAKLVVEEGKAANLLGADILLLAYRGEDGVLHAARDIPAGQSKALSPFSDADRDAFREMLTNKKPQILEGFDVYAYTDAMTPSNRAFTNVTGRTYSATALGECLLMETFKTCETPDSPTTGLKPRSYIAVVSASPLTKLGVANAKEVMSFHVIRGRW